MSLLSEFLAIWDENEALGCWASAPPFPFTPGGWGRCDGPQPPFPFTPGGGVAVMRPFNPRAIA